ncbi:hypothetical protein KC334_g4324 [Hortaea werneckii]|nr:hypothetical protein KC334_g4324 [Hortaea werneckii]KAI7026474.1 hypothetical protein KC355_g640 [Hortaea werneckii]
MDQEARLKVRREELGFGPKWVGGWGFASGGEFAAAPELWLKRDSAGLVIDRIVVKDSDFSTNRELWPSAGVIWTEDIRDITGRALIPTEVAALYNLRSRKGSETIIEARGWRVFPTLLTIRFDNFPNDEDPIFDDLDDEAFNEVVRNFHRTRDEIARDWLPEPFLWHVFESYPMPRLGDFGLCAIKKMNDPRKAEDYVMDDDCDGDPERLNEPTFRPRASKHYSAELLELISACTRYEQKDRPDFADLLKRIEHYTRPSSASDRASGLRGAAADDPEWLNEDNRVQTPPEKWKLGFAIAPNDPPAGFRNAPEVVTLASSDEAGSQGDIEGDDPFSLAPPTGELTGDIIIEAANEEKNENEEKVEAKSAKKAKSTKKVDHAAAGPSSPQKTGSKRKSRMVVEDDEYDEDDENAVRQAVKPTKKPQIKKRR